MVVINLRFLRLLIIAVPLLLIFIYLVQYFIPEEKNESPVKPLPGKLCGSFISWDETKEYFPNYSGATVIDIETRKQFNIQRRGGSNHADVQPLTAEDTATMKQIYNGEWSWKRRAIIVVMENGMKIAASMNGMPHGQGAIKGNNFNGHFCIHFLGSKTHESNKVDLAHQMMVWKAADVVASQVKALEPERTLELLFTAIDQGELQLAAGLLSGEKTDGAILELFRDYDYVKTFSITKLTDDTYEVGVLLGYDGGRKQTRKVIPVKVEKKDSGWKIDVSSVVMLLQQPGAMGNSTPEELKNL